jgi:hypothetical protein
VSKTEAPQKTGWYPKRITLGMKLKKNAQAEKGKADQTKRGTPEKRPDIKVI